MDDATYKKLKEELQEIYKNSRNLAEAAKITVGNNIDTAVNNLIKVCQQLEELLKPAEPTPAKPVTLDEAFKSEKSVKIQPKPENKVNKQETVETSTSSPKTE